MSKRLTKLTAALGAVLIVAACGSPHHRAAVTSASPSSTSTTVVANDTWTAPTVTGPPSAHNFCTLLVAVYQHEATLPQAKDLTVRQHIVADFVTTAPRIIAEAPAPVAAAATTYFQTVGSLLATLNAHGLDAANVKKGDSSSDLLSPQMRAATQTVNAYSSQNCHYTIGG